VRFSLFFEFGVALCAVRVLCVVEVAIIEQRGKEEAKVYTAG
jgi:hypothetical protein